MTAPRNPQATRRILRPRAPPTPQEDAVIRADLTRLGVYGIARKLNRAASTVYSRVHELGLPLPGWDRKAPKGPSETHLPRVAPDALLGALQKRADDTAFVAALNALGGYPYPHTFRTGPLAGKTVLVTHDGRPHLLALDAAT